MMKLYGIDCHVATREDHRTLFKQMGHDFRSFSISGHTWVVGEMAAVIGTDLKAGMQGIIGGDTVPRFQEEWGRYFQDENFDAFVVSYPPAFALLFEGLGKPVIMHIPIRYEHPWTHDREKWETFNQKLRDGIDKGLIIPVANNLYDKEYFEGYVGRPCRFIPSVCSYFPNIHINAAGYIGWGKSKIDMKGVRDKSSLGTRYKWDDLVKYRGAVWVPYQVSTMSMYEQYWSGMRILVPSKSLLLKFYQKGWGLEQFSWAYMERRPAALPWKGRLPDPNAYGSVESVSAWLDFADGYCSTLKKVEQFDSLPHLEQLLSKEVDVTPQAMDNHDRMDAAIAGWSKVFEEVRRGR